MSGNMQSSERAYGSGRTSVDAFCRGVLAVAVGSPILAAVKLRWGLLQARR